MRVLTAAAISFAALFSSQFATVEFDASASPPPVDDAEFTGQGIDLYGSSTTTQADTGQPGTGQSSSLVDPSLRTPPTGVRCRLATPDGCASEPPASVAPLTITDLASFTPAVGQLIVQPDNWGVLGIPTNFVATATDHVQHGTLLGQPVEVRWRPIAFTFDYGDGTTTTTTDAGAMWQSSDDDWTSTSTSHEYHQRGNHTATVTITFEADIATDTGWATVPGTLELPAPPEHVRIFEVQTVLTRGNCIDHPNDPGCTP